MHIFVELTTVTFLKMCSLWKIARSNGMLCYVALSFRAIKCHLMKCHLFNSKLWNKARCKRVVVAVGGNCTRAMCVRAHRCQCSSTESARSAPQRLYIPGQFVRRLRTAQKVVATVSGLWACSVNQMCNTVFSTLGYRNGLFSLEPWRQSSISQYTLVGDCLPKLIICRLSMDDWPTAVSRRHFAGGQCF